MQTTESLPAPAIAQNYHRIKSLSVIGGFLDGQKFEFTNGLNCLIGARGTGKTTALEFIGYALGNQNPADDRKQEESLFKQNLGGGRIQIAVETNDGITYHISRAYGEDPIVVTADGNPTTLTLDSGAVFRADLYRQNEIEQIADRPQYQLDLIDGFASSQIRELEQGMQEVCIALSSNAHQIIPLTAEIDTLSEALATLAGIEERLAKYSSEPGKDADAINAGHRLKGLRDREARTLNSLQQILQQHDSDLQLLKGRLLDQIKPLWDRDFASSPNHSLVLGAFEGLSHLGKEIDEFVGTARKLVAAEQSQLEQGQRDLNAAHSQQELAFRKVIEQHESARQEATERSRLERRRNDLLAQRRLRDERTAQLRALQGERQRLLDRLSEYWDERFFVRQEVAERINAALSPVIRVRLLQFGNPEQFVQLLEQALRGAGVKHGIVAGKIVSKLTPHELSEVIRHRQTRVLIERCELNMEQASKVVVALSEPEVLFELETVELDDLPRIELKDGADYKDAASLSTGQKCTTILPILLMDSDNPLLIDQPEDNLDNRFIFETVVESLRNVKQRRQLIFVTHNPNIPVLGDAERVTVLESDGAQSRKLNQGTVQECKGEIVTLLEGGEQAFKQRQERYAY